MGNGPFAAAKVPTRTHAKVPLASAANMPSQRITSAERLKRLEEAKAFLRQHLAAGRSLPERCSKRPEPQGLPRGRCTVPKMPSESDLNALEGMARMGSGRGIRQRQEDQQPPPLFRCASSLVSAAEQPLVVNCTLCPAALVAKMPKPKMAS